VAAIRRAWEDETVLYVLVALGFAVIWSALPWSRVVALSRLGAMSRSEVARLGRLGSGDRARELADTAPADSWEAELARELLRARNEREQVAAVNEILSTLEHRLAAGADNWRAALWLLALTTLGSAILGFLAGVRGELAWLAIVGLAGAATTLIARRASRWLATRARAGVDEIVALVAGDLVDREIPMPTRRRRR
jgi:hypothetical protein